VDLQTRFLSSYLATVLSQLANRKKQRKRLKPEIFAPLKKKTAARSGFLFIV